MLSSFITESAAVLVALAAAVTALTILAKFPPTRWLGRSLFAEPVREWHRREIRDVLTTETRATIGEEVERAVAPIRAEVTHNGGASLKDGIRRIEERQIIEAARAGRTEARVQDLEVGLDLVRTDIGELKSNLPPA